MSARPRRGPARHDGLILTVPRSNAVAEAIRSVSARIPVITLATDVRDCGRQTYVGPDDRRAGRVAGDPSGADRRDHRPESGVRGARRDRSSGSADRSVGRRVVNYDHSGGYPHDRECVRLLPTSTIAANSHQVQNRYSVGSSRGCPGCSTTLLAISAFQELDSVLHGQRSTAFEASRSAYVQSGAR